MSDLKLESWRTAGTSLEELLRPHTYPIAVKLVKNTSEFPEKTRRPEKKIAVCQALTLSRRFGWTVGMTGEDSGCPAANLNYGWSERKDAEPLLLQFFVESGYVANEAAAKTLIDNMDRLSQGEYSGLVVSPLTRTRIVPDVIIVYGNSAQIMRLIQGATYKEGKKLKTELLGLVASCTRGIIRTFNTSECQVAIPGTGDRVFSVVYDNEMLFAIPAAKAEQIITGMRQQRIVKYPIPTPLQMPPPFPNV